MISENQIACGCYCTIDIWDLNSLAKVKSFKAHDEWISQLLLADKTKLISCSGDNKIKIWNLKTFKCIKILQGHTGIVWYLKLNSDGNLLSCSLDRTLKLWQIPNGRLLKSISFNHSVNCVTVLSDNSIAIGLQNGEIHINDLSKEESSNKIKVHKSFLTQLNILTQSNNLLSASGNGELKLWRIRE